MASLSNLTERAIHRRLAKAYNLSPGLPSLEFPYPSELFPQAPRPAAVLIPLLCDGKAWHVLYTRRSADLPEHSGQVAFPGGRSDPGDPDPESTALREAQEEIGLAPADVRILGRLGDFITVTNYRVTPVVGVIPWPYTFLLAEAEVSHVFTIPLAWLADRAHYEERTRTLPYTSAQAKVIYYQPYDGEILWGATARFTLALIGILSGVTLS